MPAGRKADPRNIVARADAALVGLEDKQVRAVNRYLERAQRDLESELRVLYTKAQQEGLTESIAWRETRARMLLEDIDRATGKFELSKRKPIQEALGTTIQGSRDIADATMQEFLDPFGFTKGGKIGMGTIDISIESVADATRNAAARLHRHEARAIEQINEIVLSGQIRGQGWGRTAAELRRNTGMLSYQAERIVRTESLSNNDNARRKGYAEQGIMYVQRIATQDNRVCEYCAARAGEVYEVDKAPAALHPNDRCYNMPWTPEWQAEGLTNDEFWADHAKEVKDKVKADGRKPKYGKAPFEKMNGLDLPEVVWKPLYGYTQYGEDLVGTIAVPPPAPRPKPKPEPKPKPAPAPAGITTRGTRQEVRRNVTNKRAIFDSLKRTETRLGGRAAEGADLALHMEGKGVRFFGSRNANLPRLNADIIAGFDRFEDVFKTPLKTVLDDNFTVFARAADDASLRDPKGFANAYAWLGARMGGKRRRMAFNMGQRDFATRAHYDRIGYTHQRMRENGRTPWVVVSTGRKGFHTTLHELGHAMDFYVEELSSKNATVRRGLRSLWKDIDKLDGPSEYYLTNRRERVAEAFNEMMTTTETTWTPAAKRLARFYREHKEFIPNDL